MNRFYPQIDINVIEHGLDLERFVKDHRSNEDKMFNIAFVGVCAPHKGGQVFKDLVCNNKNKNIKYHMFGLNQVSGLVNGHGLIDHGAYNRKDLPRMLVDNKIDLVCLMSVCPETYSYTLTEVVSAGVPVITFDIGAIADRTKKNNLGWVIKLTNDYRLVRNEINKIINNVDEYNKVIDFINKYKIKNAANMAADYEKIYNVKYSDYDIEMLKTIIRDSFKINYTSFNSDEYYRIINSYKWRLVSKIRTPEIIRKAVRKVIR